MTNRSLSAVWCFCLLAAAGLTGCERGTSQVAPAGAPAIPVSQPLERMVTEDVEYTGRTDAVKAVDIRARVTGFLIQMPFKEGAEVKAGDLLFQIDRRPYQAQHDQALSQVTLNDASLRLARTTLARDQEIASKVPGGVSLQQLDQDRAAVDEAEARVKASQESTKIYKLNLEFTHVVSPIDGQVSRYYLTEGNLVNQDQTLLTTVVSLDPMYAYFDMDEPTLLRIRRGIIEGQIQRPQDGVFPVLMGLQGELGYPHRGTINFVNNQVNPTTGSISVRGIFPNPKQPTLASVGAFLMQDSLDGLGAYASYFQTSPGQVRLLSPGMFVRIRLPLGQPRPAVLVVDRAIGSDQGLKYVYVLDAQNKVHARPVTTGALQDDGLRVITDGLKADEWVVVGGLQQVRENMEIQPDKVAMPYPGRRMTVENKAAK
jgi:membrane fusion protein, multidrug efflux system